MGFTALATKVYKDPLTVQWMNSVKENDDIMWTGTIKGWVNFDGTSTPVIRGSHNVASITRTDTGNYQIDWTTGFTTAGYSIAAWAADQGSTMFALAPATATSTVQTGLANVQSRINGGANADADEVTVLAVGVKK